MKEIKKLTFNPKTLDEKIVGDSLEAVAQIENSEPVYLVGGVGTQSYLPSSCRRPTSDVDYAIVRPLTYSDFKEITKISEEFLLDSGYSIETRKASRYYMMIVQDRKNSESLAVEIARNSEKSFQGKRKRLEREFKNSRTKILERRNTHYRVASPEDLAVPKLMRLINSLRRNPNFISFLSGRFRHLSDEAIRKTLGKIESFREDAMISPGDAYLVDRLRVVSDIYDVRILAEITGFNREYFDIVKGEWISTSMKSKERDMVFQSILLPID